MSRQKKFIKHLEDYFLVRRFERYGLGLVLILGLVFFFIRIHWLVEDKVVDVDQFSELMQSDNTSSVYQDSNDAEGFRLSAFDPNTVRKEALYEMGLPPSTVKSIINFRASGFQYRQPKDLLRCFGVDQIMFDELVPFVVIKAERQGANNWKDRTAKEPVSKTISPFAFDPNTVSRSALESMHLPERFIKGFLNFRKSGARFYDMGDLEKVYALTHDIKASIAPYLLFPDRPSYKNKKRKVASNVTIQRFRFDPNLISKDSLLLLGIPISAASIWVNYRNSGKVYRSIEDLRSIYGMSESKLQELSDWMDFPMVIESAPKERTRKIQASLQLDPNAASLADLMRIKGIGRYYANQILWRKRQLGGFYNIDQIGEAESIPDSTFQVVKYHFVSPTLDSLRTINVNTTSRRDFADHPYISYASVNRIVTHREFVGPKLSLAYLLKLELLSEEEARILGPYLVFE